MDSFLSGNYEGQEETHMCLRICEECFLKKFIKHFVTRFGFFMGFKFQFENDKNISDKCTGKHKHGKVDKNKRYKLLSSLMKRTSLNAGKKAFLAKVLIYDDENKIYKIQAGESTNVISASKYLGEYLSSMTTMSLNPTIKPLTFRKRKRGGFSINQGLC